MIRKIIFFGQGPHAKFTYDWTKKNNLDFFFITSPRLKSQIDIKKLLSFKCKYLITKKLTLKELKKLYNSGTIAISAGAPFIFSEEVINLFNGNIFNLHNAPLPAVRGGASISWMILEGKKKWTSTIHKIEKGIDSGSILMVKTIKFPKEIKFPIDYINFIWEKDLILLDNFLNKLLHNAKIKELKQNEEKSIYYPRLNAKVNGWINFLWKGEHIERFVFAFSYDYDGARSYIKNNLIKIFSVKSKKNINETKHPFVVGVIFKIKNKNLYLHTIDGILIIDKYVCKAKIKIGDRIHTPSKILDSALSERVFFNP